MNCTNFLHVDVELVSIGVVKSLVEVDNVVKLVVGDAKIKIIKRKLCH